MSKVESSDHLAFVDVLRGIAVLLVVLVHTAQGVSNLHPAVAALAKAGQFGVQLFFVASAYTLCLSFERRRDEPNAVRAFFLRRYFRIAPLYYIGIGFYLFCTTARLYFQTHVLQVSETYSASNILANVLLVHGLVPAANNGVVPGGWSIGTEVLFYALFPLLFPLVRRAVRKKGKIGLVGALAVTMLLNLALLACFGFRVENNSFLFYFIANQLPVFVLGMGVYFLEPRLDRLKFFGGGLAVAVVGTLAVAKVHSGLLHFGTPVIAGCLFVVLLIGLKASRWAPAILRRIGVLSYSVYVSHFFFAAFAVPLLLRRLGLEGSLALLVSFCAVVGLSVGVATVTERLIEARGIKLGSKVVKTLQGRRRPTLTALAPSI